MAGRNQQKLEAVRTELSTDAPEAANVPILTADTADKASLVSLAAQADVVIAMAGPYARCGRPMVEVRLS